MMSNNNQSGGPIDAVSLDTIKDAMLLMINKKERSIDDVVTLFRSAFAPLALSFNQEGMEVHEIVKMFKEELLENDEMLYDVESSVFYATAVIMYPRPKGKEKAVFANVQDVMESLNFLFTVMGKKFYGYVVRKRLQGRVASLKSMRDIIRNTDDSYLLRSLSMQNKDQAIENMTEARIQMEQHAYKKQKEMEEAEKKREEDKEKNKDNDA